MQLLLQIPNNEAGVKILNWKSNTELKVTKATVTTTTNDLIEQNKDPSEVS